MVSLKSNPRDIKDANALGSFALGEGSSNIANYLSINNHTFSFSNTQWIEW